jgi:hypothetical protein
VANLLPLSTTLAKLVEKFAAGVVDTGGKNTFLLHDESLHTPPTHHYRTI